ncbi:MAG TPA: cysteine hydrolase family protein [Bryobacteraceae bacterium]|nr:cysteine hydrolase family protein [Bryobacteraceae bacterium]
MYRRSFLTILPGALGMAMAQAPQSERESLPNRPKVPGTLSLRARRRGEQPPGSGKILVSEEVLRWEVAQTAIIIIDMWDTHTCHTSAQRVAAMAPRMNQVVDAARSRGVMIIHAPSDTMKFYEGRPQRLRMQRAPMAPSPIPVRATEPDREEQLKMPAAACDDPIFKNFTGPAPSTTRGVYPWEQEHPAIEIAGYDGISDSGQEIYNFCKQEGITNIALMGVHTNICILNRAFGVRAMKRLGFNVVVARDLTDAMYDPRKRPFVSHARGTDLVVEHIEADWCPSILSEDLTRVIPATDGPS